MYFADDATETAIVGFLLMAVAVSFLTLENCVNGVIVTVNRRPAVTDVVMPNMFILVLVMGEIVVDGDVDCHGFVVVDNAIMGVTEPIIPSKRIRCGVLASVGTLLVHAIDAISVAEHVASYEVVREPIAVVMVDGVVGRPLEMTETAVSPIKDEIFLVIAISWGIRLLVVVSGGEKVMPPLHCRETMREPKVEEIVSVRIENPSSVTADRLYLTRVLRLVLLTVMGVGIITDEVADHAVTKIRVRSSVRLAVGNVAAIVISLDGGMDEV